MAADNTTATTAVPAKHEAAGFPPFKTETFPSQLFWLALTFCFLFVVLWRVAGPRINSAITGRRNTINAAIDGASQARAEAEAAQAAYEDALAKARARANALAEETRSKLNAEIAHAKAQADAVDRLRAEAFGIPAILKHLFYFNEIIEVLIVRPAQLLGAAFGRILDPQIIDGAVREVASIARGFGTLVRSFETGLVRAYALILAFGAALFIVYYAIAAGGAH